MQPKKFYKILSLILVVVIFIQAIPTNLIPAQAAADVSDNPKYFSDNELLSLESLEIDKDQYIVTEDNADGMFFASTFCTKLQVIFAYCCKYKMYKVASSFCRH